MTQIKNAYMLIMMCFMMLACSSSLQAAQKNDGQFLIMNEVLGGGLIDQIESEGITQTRGTLGQSIAIIGKSDLDPITVTDMEQYSGFWYAIGDQDDKPVVSFMMPDVININDEAVDVVDKIKIGLNKSNDTPTPITVTVSVNTVCDVSDYTISNGTVTNTNALTAVIANGSDFNDDIFVKIIDDIKIENDETIQLKIDSVQGDVVIGSLDTLNINILKNDAYSLTGTVVYYGSQTGFFTVRAIHSTTKEPFTYSSVWTPDSIIEDYALTVAPGSYTITAFIDTSTGNYNKCKDSWEAYTVVTNIDHNILSVDQLTIVDPDYRYANQDSDVTLTYADWIANYSAIGGPGTDFDLDGYSNFQEFLNGTDPTQDDAAYVYDGYDPGTDDRPQSSESKYQIITTYPLKPQTLLGSDGGVFFVDINYTTSDYDYINEVNDSNGGTVGLGLDIHFNGTLFELADVIKPFTDHIAIDVKKYTDYIYDKKNDPDQYIEDGYQVTDTIFRLTWTDSGGEWPSVKKLPIRLCKLKFIVKADLQGVEYGDTSVIRFKATDKVVYGYNLYASPVSVEFNRFNYDIDGDGEIKALEDGIQIIRFMFKLIDKRDSSSTVQDIGDNAIRTTPKAIWDYIDNNGNSLTTLDVDRDQDADAFSDGIMILRYMFGIKDGDVITEYVVDQDQVKPEDVVPNIEQYMLKQGTGKIDPNSEQ